VDKQEAEGLLRGKLSEYCVLPYPKLVARIGTDDHVTMAGASGAEYQLEVQVFWEDEPRGNVRVIGSIDDGGLRAFFPLTKSFIMAPDGTFVGEGPT
jgi:hypothetical protein